MKNINISFFVILITIQCVYSRTVQDVLEDFQYAFDETHQEIGRHQSIAHAEGQTQIGRIKESISKSSWNIQSMLESATKDLANQVRMIIGEAGLIGQEERVQHCLTKEGSDVNILIQQSFAMREICSGLANKEIGKLENIWNPFYEKQSQLHNSVESVKDRCSGSTTPNNMQDCLIENLYILERPHVENMIRSMANVISLGLEFVLKAEYYIADCSSLAQDKTKNDRLPIINEFKNCVLLVIQN